MPPARLGPEALALVAVGEAAAEQHLQARAGGGTDAHLRLQEVEVTAAEAPEDSDAEAVGELVQLRRWALEMVRSEFEERTWRAFWQTVVEGRSPADIAADLGVSPATVRMAKSRVLHRLKEAFGDLIQ